MRDMLMSKSDVNITYCLQEPETGYPRYVGLSERGFDRITEHKKGKDRNKKDGCGAWIFSLLERGLTPDAFIIEEYSTAEQMSEGEVFWVAYLKMIGCDLLNKTEGGEHGRHSYETRMKISKSMKGKVSNVKGKKLGPRPEHVKQKISSKGKGKHAGPRTEEVRRRISETMKRIRLCSRRDWRLK